MSHENSEILEEYNRFCKDMHEGNILYNVDKTNSWGEYLLIVNIATVIYNGVKTYSMLLLGLKKKGKEFLSRNIKIKITPDFARNIPFLKYVGHCTFNLVPQLKEVNVNLGLATIYGEIDLKKYVQKLTTRKPKQRKYSADGSPIVKRTDNE